MQSSDPGGDVSWHQDVQRHLPTAALPVTAGCFSFSLRLQIHGAITPRLNKYCNVLQIYCGVQIYITSLESCVFRVCNLCRVLMCCWHLSLCGLLFYFVKRMLEKCVSVFVTLVTSEISLSLTGRGRDRTLGFQCNKTIANKWCDDFFQDVPSFSFF